MCKWGLDPENCSEAIGGVCPGGLGENSIFDCMVKKHGIECV